MKGMVFTEFLDFVQGSLGADMVDDIIEDAAPPNAGAYTAVGTYPYAEMGALVAALGRRTGCPVPDLLQTFGRHLCGRFVVRFPEFFPANSEFFTFLDSVDRHIHVEVHKLYPEAELPRFEMTHGGHDTVFLDYDSCRPLEALAEGMILAASDHFGQAVEIEKLHLPTEGRTVTRFVIRKVEARLAA